MQLVSKISFKTVCKAPEMATLEVTDENGNKKTVLRGIEKQYMRVVGVCRNTVIKNSQYGDSIEFQGDFRAINIDSGEVFNSGKLFLPSIAETFISNAMENVRYTDGFSGLELAFDIGIKPASNPMGYEYTVKPLIEPEQTTDRLADMLKSLPALEALPETKKVKGEK